MNAELISGRSSHESHPSETYVLPNFSACSPSGSRAFSFAHMLSWHESSSSLPIFLELGGP
eukprot:3559028-Prymnesium_polylepis.2